MIKGIKNDKRHLLENSSKLLETPFVKSSWVKKNKQAQ